MQIFLTAQGVGTLNPALFKLTVWIKVKVDFSGFGDDYYLFKFIICYDFFPLSRYIYFFTLKKKKKKNNK